MRAEATGLLRDGDRVVGLTYRDEHGEQHEVRARTMQDRFLSGLLRADRPAGTPAALRVLQRVPALQLLPALLVGSGFRPDPVRTPAAPARPRQPA
jgi:hypothetical protein